MTLDRHTHVIQYYSSLQKFYDVVFENSGYYNLGWMPEGERYDLTTGQRNLVELVIDPLRRLGGRRILDVGCGQGAPAEQTAKALGASVIGLELLKSQLKICRKRIFPALHFVRGDASVMPFGDGSIDGVYSLESAFHYPDKAGFIREAARILRPGGVFSVADIMKKSGRSSGRILKGIQRAAGAAEFYSLDQYLFVANNSGLRLVSNTDLTSGVARSLKLIAGQIRKHWATLRDHIPLRLLGLATAACWTHPLTGRFLPVEYRWLVFEKSGQSQ